MSSAETAGRRLGEGRSGGDEVLRGAGAGDEATGGHLRLDREVVPAHRRQTDRLRDTVLQVSNSTFCNNRSVRR